MRISDWSSDVCSSDLHQQDARPVCHAVSAKCWGRQRGWNAKRGERHAHRIRIGKARADNADEERGDGYEGEAAVDTAMQPGGRADGGQTVWSRRSHFGASIDGNSDVEGKGGAVRVEV